MSINMNNGGNQTVAILAVLVLVVFAWDLGRRQALNTLLVGDAYPTGSEVPEGGYSPDDSDGLNGKGTSKIGKTFFIVSTGESVKVKDQPAGMEVKVSSLSLSETGWVGIRDGDGRILKREWELPFPGNEEEHKKE